MASKEDKSHKQIRLASENILNSKREIIYQMVELADYVGQKPFHWKDFNSQHVTGIRWWREKLAASLPANLSVKKIKNKIRN